jgi:hypothetical protein
VQGNLLFAEFNETCGQAGRKYIAGNHFGEFRVFDACTGQCVGDLESPRLGSRSIRAFRPGGEELIAVINAGRQDAVLGLKRASSARGAVPVWCQQLCPFVVVQQRALGLEYHSRIGDDRRPVSCRSGQQCGVAIYTARALVTTP